MDRLIPPVVAWSPLNGDEWSANSLLKKDQVLIGFYPPEDMDLQWLAHYLEQCLHTAFLSYEVQKANQQKQNGQIDARFSSATVSFPTDSPSDSSETVYSYTMSGRCSSTSIRCQGLKTQQESQNCDVLLVREECALEGILFPCKVQTEEAYRFDASAHRIDIRSSTIQGLTNGVQTFRQMIDGSDHAQGLLPCGRIMDGPRFAWRGCLLDVSRHFMDLRFLFRLVEMFSYHKLNKLHLHLVDDQGWRMEIKKYPLLTERGAWRLGMSEQQQYGGFYTQKELKSLLNFAKHLNIEIIPEIELPGHCMAALASYPYLGCTQKAHTVPHQWGIYEDVYCAGRESTFEFLENVLAEVCELFPSDYIHIGGDEVPKTRWHHCKDCQQRITEENLSNEEQLQSWFIRRIARLLKTKFNRRIIGWDEILEGGLEPSATVQSWRGFNGAFQAALQGQNAIVSPTSHCYFDYPLVTTDIRQVYSFEPVPSNLPDANTKFIVGGECCMWTERAPQHLVLTRIFPRILALATIFWTPKLIKDNLRFEVFHCLVRDVHIPLRLEKLGIKCDDGLVKPPTTALPCQITTTMNMYQNYFPECAFDNDPASFFWSNCAPVEGDLFTIQFTYPLGIDRATGFHVEVLTGKPFEPERDQLQHGFLDVMWTETDQPDPQAVWIQILEIHNGSGSTHCSKVQGRLAALRLRVASSQEQWLVIRQIALSF